MSKCPKCKVDLENGIAIKTDDWSYIAVLSKPLITADELELIDVLKCPKCGHSITLNESYTTQCPMRSVSTMKPRVDVLC